MGTYEEKKEALERLIKDKRKKLREFAAKESKSAKSERNHRLIMLGATLEAMLKADSGVTAAAVLREAEKRLAAERAAAKEKSSKMLAAKKQKSQKNGIVPKPDTTFA